MNMDPNATLKHVIELVRDNVRDDDAAGTILASLAELLRWMARGGFCPSLTELDRAAEVLLANAAFQAEER